MVEPFELMKTYRNVDCTYIYLSVMQLVVEALDKIIKFIIEL